MDPEQELALYMRSRGVQHAVMKDMLDQFAHNLAEAIRRDLDEHDTAAMAANLIDPKIPPAS